ASVMGMMNSDKLFRLAAALRETATRLDDGAYYQWTNQGACNCGHLAQTLTTKSRAEIHSMALEKAGDWSEHVVDYCATSRYPIDHIITTMLDAGLTRRDLSDLERLRSNVVRVRLPEGRRALDYRRRDDVVLYMRTWADLLHEKAEAQAILHRRAA
ncbi:MAG: hypothetical protein VX223_10820, partial [Myxococcota bacterium]|nr:hypothetical protein [Myxococcota bacterium]